MKTLKRGALRRWLQPRNAYSEATLLVRTSDYGLAIATSAEDRTYGSLRHITLTIGF